jgi:hypothetical protein
MRTLIAGVKPCLSTYFPLLILIFTTQLNGLLKMLQEIALSYEEQRAIDEFVQVLDRLSEKLNEMPTSGECRKRERSILPINSISVVC